MVLLVHGYGGDRNSWLFLHEPLAARYRVYALDLPGHGTSSKDVGDGSVGLLADAVLGVLDAIGVERAHLVGHSLGGAVAAAAAAGHPERVRSLTLIAPAGFGPEINAGYLRGFADAQTRRELKPVVGQLFADESLVTRQVVDDLLAYKRLDGVDAALHTLLGTLLAEGGDTQRIDSAAALAATRRRGAGHGGLGPRGPDHPGRAGRVGGRRGQPRDRRRRAHGRTWNARPRCRPPSRRRSPGGDTRPADREPALVFVSAGGCSRPPPADTKNPRCRRKLPLSRKASQEHIRGKHFLNLLPLLMTPAASA